MSPSRSSSVGLLYAVVVCLVCARGLAAEPAAGVAVEPAGLLQLGTVRAWEDAPVLFRIVNRTDKPVRIVQVRAGCSCTIAEPPPKEPMQPGKSVPLRLRVVAGKLCEGTFERTAFVELEGAPVRLLTVRYAGTVAEAIAVTPSRNIRLGLIAEPDEPWERTFEITGALPDVKRVVLGKPEADGGLLVSLAETARAKYVLTVKPTLPQARGRFLAHVRIPVVKPEKHPPLELTLTGQVGRILELSPGLLVIPRTQAKGAGPVCRDVRVVAVSPAPVATGAATPGAGTPSGEVREAVAAAGLSLTVPPGITATPADLPDGQGTVLRVTFGMAKLAGGARGEILVTSACCGDGRVRFVVADAAGGKRP